MLLQITEAERNRDLEGDIREMEQAFNFRNEKKKKTKKQKKGEESGLQATLHSLFPPSLSLFPLSPSLARALSLALTPCVETFSFSVRESPTKQEHAHTTTKHTETQNYRYR